MAESRSGAGHRAGSSAHNVLPRRARLVSSAPPRSPNLLLPAASGTVLVPSFPSSGWTELNGTAYWARSRHHAQAGPRRFEDRSKALRLKEASAHRERPGVANPADVAGDVDRPLEQPVATARDERAAVGPRRARVPGRQPGVAGASAGTAEPPAAQERARAVAVDPRHRDLHALDRSQAAAAAPTIARVQR